MQQQQQRLCARDVALSGRSAWCVLAFGRVRRELLKNKQVLFVGYKMPHPLENRFVLRLQTREGTTPRAALDDALTSLLAQVDALERNAQVRWTWALP